MSRIAGGFDDCGVPLARALPLLAALTYLDVSHCSLRSEGGRAVVAAAGSLRQLASLNISSNELRAAGLQALLAWRDQAHALTALDLAHNELRDAGLRHIPAMLERMPALQQLNISGNADSQDSVDVAWPDPKLLGNVHLRDICLDGQSRALESIAPHLPMLTRLRLTALALCLDEQQRSILASATALQRLTLRVKFMSRFPAPALTQMTALALIVQEGWTECCLKELAKVAAQMSQLQALHLETEPGGIHPEADFAVLDEELAQCLSPLVQLTQLHLGRIDDWLMNPVDEQLLAALAKLTALRDVELGIMRCMPPCTDALQAAVAGVTSFRRMHTPHPHSDADSIGTISDWASAMPTLRQLIVEHHILPGNNPQSVQLPHTLTALELRFMSKLQSLATWPGPDLRRTHEAQCAICMLLPHVLGPLSALQSLVLSGLPHHAPEVQLLWATLTRCPLLTRLTVGMTANTAAELVAAAAAESLPAFVHMRKLELSGFASYTDAQARDDAGVLQSAVLRLTALRELSFVATAAVGLPQFASKLICSLACLTSLRIHLRGVKNEQMLGSCGSYMRKSEIWTDPTESGLNVKALANKYGVRYKVCVLHV